MTPAYPRGSSKSLLALEKEGAVRLGQVRSGTSQPSSSSAASFVQGSYGHRYLHSLQLKAHSSRKPELLQSLFKSLLPSVRVLKIYFSSEQESQSLPLCFLSCPTPKKRVAWPHWQTVSHKSLWARWFIIYCPLYPTKYFHITPVTCWSDFAIHFPILTEIFI